MNAIATGIVLDKSLSGESGFLYKLLSPESGLVSLYKRASAKKTSALPDFFDEISAEITNAKSGDLLFLGDFETLKRRTALAADYDSFCAASDIARLILKNSRYIEHSGALYGAFSGALDALEARAHPAVVKIKFLYVFARDEGYPVKESFVRSLDADTIKMLSHILSTPSVDCAPSGSEALLSALEHWVFSITDIMRP